ncbi:MAG: hypothetical protein IKO27_09540 [Ruminococcus sp.]|nr:hypothetical protein [Ruminococcus sp.]
MNAFKRSLTLLTAMLMLGGCASKTASEDEAGVTVSGLTGTETAVPEMPASEAESSGSQGESAGLYDVSPIVQAYLSGDNSGLDKEQGEILAAASRLIDETVNDKMSFVEKELALHDRLTADTAYDDNSLSVIGIHLPGSDTPYGVLIDHTGICTGYTVTFAMLMQMLGAEAVTVYSVNSSGDEHAWDLVKIEGEWYAVDLTWDDIHSDNGSLYAQHKFFNCTDEVLADTGHIWDTDSYPAASGTKYSYAELYPDEVSSMEDIEDAVKRSAEKGFGEVYLLPGKGFGALGAKAEDKKYEQMKKLLKEMGYDLHSHYEYETTRGTVLYVQFRTSDGRKK